MKRTSSESSGSGDEFFDAIDHLEHDEPNNDLNDTECTTRLHSLRESDLENESIQSSSKAEPPSPTQIPIQTLREEDKESANFFAKDIIRDGVVDDTSYSNKSLIDTMSSESSSLEDNTTEETQQIISPHVIDDTTDPATDTKQQKQENTVPPLNINELPSRSTTKQDHDDTIIYTVSTKEIEDITGKEYNDEEKETLNKLVDKLQVVDMIRQEQEEEERSVKEDDSEGGGEGIVDPNESIQTNNSGVEEQCVTPQRVVDCGNFTNSLVCDIKSPLEALYLFCPGGERGKTLDYNDSNDGSKKGNTIPSASPPTRTSIDNEMDMLIEAKEIPSPPLMSGKNIDDQRQLDLELGDSSDSDDSSISSGDKYQIVNKDTGEKMDMRDVMKQIDEVGTCDALDTARYSFLPTKVQLEYQRETMRQFQVDETSVASSAMEPNMAVTSFDTEMTEESSPQTTQRKKSSIKFSKKAIQSKMAAKVAELKTSRQQKLNRKRTTSADMIPSNAIHVRSSSKHKHHGSKSIDVQAYDSSFNPMLLIKTMNSAHTGPAWCASFSNNGRWLATGGEDGNVCIWAVSPKSKVLHPDGLPTDEQEEEGIPVEISSSEHEDIECLPIGKDEKEDTTAAEEGQHSLHFIGTGPELATNLEILSSEPIRRFKDHTADVIDLSWSHTNFLISASLDCSVRLYHFSKPGCLHLFKHASLVASVDFHPTDDRYFISGGIDKKLRLWDIPEGRVKEWAQAPDVITASRFTPDGKYAVSGLFKGQVYFYDVDDGLKYYTQIACRNRSGKNKLGKKVTGISFVRGQRDDWTEVKEKTATAEHETSASKLTEKLSDTRKDMARRMASVSSAFRQNTSASERAEALRYTERMLVTTNDSRVRLYGLNDFCLMRKYKGHSNHSMQIRARLSESGSHIISGSESGHVYIWDTLDKNRSKKGHVNLKLHTTTTTRDKTKSSNNFEACRAPLPIVTDTVFFPTKSMHEALLSSDQVFPFALGMDRVGDDLSSAAILTLDYDGTMRVFLRKSCIDNILDAATPRGGIVL